MQRCLSIASGAWLLLSSLLDTRTAAAATVSEPVGQQIYESTCARCHSSGFPKAPQLGDRRAWRPMIREGIGHLTDEVVKGRGAMPANGGNPDLGRKDIERAVVYMGRQAGAGWKAR